MMSTLSRRVLSNLGPFRAARFFHILRDIGMVPNRGI